MWCTKNPLVLTLLFKTEKQDKMKSISISGVVRKESGTKEAKISRKNGLVPCVVYGSGDPLHVLIDERQFKKVVYTPNVYVIDLDVEGDKRSVFLKDIQFHPVNDRILHVDFFEPKEGDKITMNIPVRLKGTAIGVLNGGRLRLTFRTLKVKALVADFPDAIEIDISKLRIGQGIRISELNFPGLEFLDAPNNYAVAIKTARGAVDLDEEADAEEDAPAAEATEEAIEA